MDKVDERVSIVEDKVDANYKELDQRINVLANQHHQVARTNEPLGFTSDQSSLQVSSIGDRPTPAAQDWLRLSRNNRQEEQYWRYRMSLRVWPVPGPDLRSSFMDYLAAKLQFPPDDVAKFGDFDVEKYFDPRLKMSNEVVVVFRS